MLVIRPTQKLQNALPAMWTGGTSDNALGDWYVNRLVVDRQPLLLLVSAASLLPALVRARSVRALPTQIGEIVARRLTRLGVAKPLIDAERRAMLPVHIGTTIDRSVLGIMVDFAKILPSYLKKGWDDTALGVVEDRLGGTPCYASRRPDLVVFPKLKAPELLAAKWAG